ncbi:MAG: DUF1289 domain-containing protein [Gammaproteobacteria bacterium]|nr:DUF1289 domain-containing protein [Gammaproteobacteria bacterium]
MTETPCIGICSTIYGDEICRGCFRHYQDVIDWNTFDSPKKIEILQMLDQLTMRILKQKINLFDPALLQKKCLEYKLRIRLNWNPHTWAHVLMREGMDKIVQPEKYGFQIKSPFKHLSIAKLVEIIDDELFLEARNQHVPYRSL